VGDHDCRGRRVCGGGLHGALVGANLGIAYDNLSEHRHAIEYGDHALRIAREIGDRYGECNALWNMSTTFDKLGDQKEAIKLAEASLKIMEEIEDPFAPKIREKLEEWRKS